MQPPGFAKKPLSGTVNGDAANGTAARIKWSSQPVLPRPEWLS